MSSLLNTQGVLCRFSVAHSSLVTCPVNSRGFCLPDITAPSSQLKETTRCCLGAPSLWHDRTSSLGLKLEQLNGSPHFSHLSGITVFHVWCPLSWELFFQRICPIFLVVWDGRVNLTCYSIFTGIIRLLFLLILTTALWGKVTGPESHSPFSNACS